MSPLERLSIYAAEQASLTLYAQRSHEFVMISESYLRPSRKCLRPSLFASLRTVRWRTVQFSERPAATRGPHHRRRCRRDQRNPGKRKHPTDRVDDLRDVAGALTQGGPRRRVIICDRPVVVSADLSGSRVSRLHATTNNMKLTNQPEHGIAQ